MFDFIKKIFGNQESIFKEIYKNINKNIFTNPSIIKYDTYKIIDILDKQLNTKLETNPYIIKAVCPNCNNQLPKMPERKTTCKSCKKLIYKRTHYFTKEPILLTELQIDDYDYKASVHYSKNELKRRVIMGFEDVLERGIYLRDILNYFLIEYKKDYKFGCYTNILHRLSMLDYLEDKKIDSFKKDLNHFYLSINNPSNVGSYAVKNNLLKQYPPFKPYNDKALSDFWIETIKNKCIELKIENLKQIFIECNTVIYDELKIVPIKPELVWERIQNKIV